MNKKTIAMVFGIFLLSVFAVHAENSDKVYIIDAQIFGNDTAILRNIVSKDGTISHFPTIDTDYKIKVLSDSKELYQANLGVSFVISLDPIGTAKAESVIIQARVPYFSAAEEIVIYHSGKQILKIDLSEKSCDNDGKCEDNENFYNCPSDCPKEIVDGHCMSDGICDLNCSPKDPDCVEEPKSKTWIYFLVIGVIIVILLTVLFFKLRGQAYEGNNQISY